MELIIDKDSWCSSEELYIKYEFSAYELRKARENGLPFRISPGGRRYYYREKDIHDYYSGRIGNDVKGGSGIC